MTSRKIMYFIAVIALLLLNVFYVDYQIFVLLILVIAIPAISFLIFTIAKIGLDIYLSSDSSIFVSGKDNRLFVQVENACPLPISDGRLKLYKSFSEEEYSEEIDLHVNVLGRRNCSEVALKAEHAGIMTVEVSRLDLYDFLYISHSKRMFNGAKEMVVLPELIDLNNDASGSTSDVCDISMDDMQLALNMAATDNNSDEIELKVYADGDDYRRIHWKLSANNPNDDLIVKNFKDEMENVMAIVPDLTKTDINGFRDNLDRIYQMAYSYGYYYASRGIDSAFFVWNTEKNVLEEFKFSDRKSLIYSMIKLFRVKCCKDYLEKIGHELSGASKDNGKPLLITARDMKEKEFKVITII